MVKSFFNSFFNGIGRTLGRILAYILIALVFFFIYENAHAASFSPHSGFHSCTSGQYDIEKSNGDGTYGSVGTSYNIFFHYISFYSTYNLQPNKYYDIIITFKSNISNNILNNDYGENLGASGIKVFINSSLCGADTGEVTVSGYSISGKKLTIRVMNGTSLIDYWQLYTRFTFNGSNGIDTTTIEAVDLTGSSGIIENATDNTNSIINNNNENTQDIIDNQNENTQDIIDSQQDINDSINSSCKTGPYVLDDTFIGTDNAYLDSSGNIVTTSSGFVTEYLSVLPSSTYTLTYNDDVPSTYYVCTYLNNKTLQSCFALHGGGSGSLYNHTFTLNNFISYIRVSVRKSRRFTLAGAVCNNFELEAQNATNSKLDQMLAMPTVRLVLFSDSVQDWADYVSNPVGNFLLLPVQLVSKINTVSQNTCTDFNLGSLLGTNLTMECFTLSDILPSALVTTLDTIASMSLSFVILKKIYETITNMITLGGENEVKSYFHVPTPMEFMGSIFGG